MTETSVASAPKRPDNLGPEFVWARVAIDGDASRPESIFHAWVDPTNLWNGFAQPVFSLEEAQRVVEWANKSAEECAEADVFVWVTETMLVEVHRGYGDQGDDNVTTVFRGPTYGIGDGWCWQFVDDPRYAVKPGGITAQSLLTAAADLLEPENLTLDQEYTRGICELLADSLLLTREAFMDERKDIVLELIRQEKGRG